jgi:hypothetical protein
MTRAWGETQWQKAYLAWVGPRVPSLGSGKITVIMIRQLFCFCIAFFKHTFWFGGDKLQ